MDTTAELNQQDVPFNGDDARQRALELLAEGWSEDRVAAQVGVAQATLRKWRQGPDSVQQNAESAKADEPSMLHGGIACCANRIHALDKRWRALLTIVDERGADPVMAHVPGGRTGLLTRSFKTIGKGEDSLIISFFHIDFRLLAELSRIEKQAAQELGQWGNPPEIAPQENNAEKLDLTLLTKEELDQLAALFQKARRSRVEAPAQSPCQPQPCAPPLVKEQSSDGNEDRDVDGSGMAFDAAQSPCQPQPCVPPLVKEQSSDGNDDRYADDLAMFDGP